MAKKPPGREKAKKHVKKRFFRNNLSKAFCRAGSLHFCNQNKNLQFLIPIMTNNVKIIFISYLACRRFSRSPSRFVFYDQKDILRPTAWDRDHRLSNLENLKKSIFWVCLMQNAQAYRTAHCACLQRGNVQRKSYCSALNSIQVYINVHCVYAYSTA